MSEEPKTTPSEEARSPWRRTLRTLLWGGLGAAFLVLAFVQLTRPHAPPPSADDNTTPTATPQAPASEEVARPSPSPAKPGARPGATARQPSIADVGPGTPRPVGVAPTPGFVAPMPGAGPGEPAPFPTTVIPGSPGSTPPPSSGVPQPAPPLDTTEGKLFEARRLLSEGKYVQAAPMTKQLAQDFPTEPRAHIYDAVSALHEADRERAAKELDAALANVKSGRQALEVLIYGGLVAFGLGRYDQAVELWEAAAKSYPPFEKQYRSMIEQARSRAGGGGPTP